MVSSTHAHAQAKQKLANPSIEAINHVRESIRAAWSNEERASRARQGYSRRQSMLLSILVYGDCRVM